MRTLPLLLAGTVAAASLSVVTSVAIAPAAHAAPAGTAYALSGSNLLSFPLAKPAAVTTTAITGITAGESLVGLDGRPQNGRLYALGIDASLDRGTLYVVHQRSGYAAPVGAPSAIALTTDGVTAVDLPDPAVVGYGFDVNPAVDRIRVVAGSLNFRLNPTTGLAVDGDNTGSTSGVVSGTNPDGPTNGATTTVDAAAYTNDVANNGNVTTLYGLDSASDTLTRASVPNAGQQANATPVTLAGTGLDFGTVGGFDIASGVDATTSNQPVTAGAGYAAMTVAGTSGLYRIELTDASATYLGAIGAGTVPVQGLALLRDTDEGYPAVGLAATGDQLVRFSTATPGTTTTQAINTVNLVAGEALVALAWRPQTGQLYSVGVDGGADTASLYLVDPQTGALTVVGTASGLAWTTDGATPADLPLASTAWGLTVDPTADRFRLSNVAGFNARFRPDGIAVDGNLGGAVSVTGTNPDGDAEAVAPAYTNGWGRAVPSADPATLYVLDPAGNRLLVQSPPTAGTLAGGKPVTLGGAPLDFAETAALGIPATVAVTSPGAAAAGPAYAVLTVAGQLGVYRLDLATARATSLGALSVPLRGLALGEAEPDPAAAPVPVSPAVLARVARPRQAKRVVDSGRVLRCPAAFPRATCTTKVRVVASYTVKVRGKLRPRTAVVATKTVSTARGKATRVKATLTPKGVRLLKKRGRLTTRIVIVAPTGPQGAARTTTIRLVLRKSRL